MVLCKLGLCLPSGCSSLLSSTMLLSSFTSRVHFKLLQTNSIWEQTSYSSTTRLAMTFRKSILPIAPSSANPTTQPGVSILLNWNPLLDVYWTRTIECSLNEPLSMLLGDVGLASCMRVSACGLLYGSECQFCPKCLSLFSSSLARSEDTYVWSPCAFVSNT
jgi:hypothetical protein